LPFFREVVFLKADLAPAGFFGPSAAVFRRPLVVGNGASGGAAGATGGATSEAGAVAGCGWTTCFPARRRFAPTWVAATTAATPLGRGGCSTAVAGAGIGGGAAREVAGAATEEAGGRAAVGGGSMARGGVLGGGGEGGGRAEISLPRARVKE
jgi:hypothetical protein